ncbi:ATP-dependent helicase [Candidatus Merdisoma sp. HCP28S3_D10]|uniref:ATP-dependent helicase n=1 Tax=unclassified Candidatus Merdisoma TaxID=3099611 RepID=UPI003F8868D4
MNSLSEVQQKAVTHRDGPMLVLAGPGSGKTMVLTRRVQYLTEYYHIPPGEILVITFTKAAAREMKERYLRLTGSAHTAVSFGTFHAVFFQILKLAYGYGAEHILREEEKYQFLREVVYKQKLEPDDEAELIGSIASEISKVKNDRVKLQEYKATSCNTKSFIAIFNEYDNRLRRSNKIDFDDMLVYCYELLKERKDILGAWQRKFRYILVDEFQDINQLQYDIVRLLAAPEDNLFIVGDDDQSIYRFRGARPEIMLHFEQDYPAAKRVLLDVNYRCSRLIVEGACRVIENNKQRFSKKICANNQEGPPILHHRFRDQEAEYECVIDKIKTYREKGGSYRDIAVLFRTNTQPRKLVEELISEGIPFRMRDALPNLYDHWIVRDIFAYLHMAQDMKQGMVKRSDFLQVMNRPKRYLGRECLESEYISWEALLAWYDDKPWVCERIEKLEKDLKLCSHLSPTGALHYIRNIIGYEEYLKEYADYKGRKPEDLFGILDELKELSSGFKTLAEWEAHIAVIRAELLKQAREREQNTDGVVLSTMHSSKGLEYRIVFIIDANEGITPHRRVLFEEDMEEERRLFYVAMTRAKELLYIFSVQKLYGKKAEQSRFVEELLDV